MMSKTRQPSTRAIILSKTRQPQKGPSLNGRTIDTEHRTIWRPNTEPNLLLESRTKLSPERPIRHRSALTLGDGGSSATRDLERKTPAKVLLNVTVQRCMWPLQVIALAEWSVADLISVVLRQYVKEGRKPLLITTENSAYGLHYSQFSLECLDSKEMLIESGSRNFFLCPKVFPAIDSASESGVTAPSTSCSNEAITKKVFAFGVQWHSFMEFLL